MNVISKKDIPSPRALKVLTTSNSGTDVRKCEVEETLSPQSLKSTAVTDFGKVITFLKALCLKSVINSVVVFVYFSTIFYITNVQYVTAIMLIVSRVIK
jgi:hypothetical protein